MAIGSGTSARNVGIWNWQQAQDAIGKGQGLINSAQDGALLSLGKGCGQARDDATKDYGEAIDLLNPWYDAGKDALGVYQGSIGVGGDSACDAAVSAFREAPGYRYSVDQATDAIARKASATGALGSGNTLAAISDRAQNMADQGYKDWQAQVLGLSDRGQQAAGTQAGLQGQLGNTLATLGQNQGNAEAGVYTGLAGLGVNNLWQGTSAGMNAVTQAQKTAQAQQIFDGNGCVTESPNA
ncbi:hypothetical protein IED13_04150 [Bosea sp. SSUT16]|jgi:hypothetical protein|uniref:Uncharacterized protein n=1 Tax=Bosea spartocytisi TaxID=2773451 RepID=A0A927E648_9HYPH|nr:hypothetical protein [Bosea spartocytisi]MBD3844877.1 hypothetical protein [Bosea spartocytisi]MCT4471079.1 hypothetical protein [Bosea spartocytisi]